MMSSFFSSLIYFSRYSFFFPLPLERDAFESSLIFLLSFVLLFPCRHLPCNDGRIVPLIDQSVSGLSQIEILEPIGSLRSLCYSLVQKPRLGVENGSSCTGIVGARQEDEDVNLLKLWGLTGGWVDASMREGFSLGRQ
ncbi:hypothetical protein BP00DRAFT_68238 [Aspergillus indologenus CBS 114.80]|uniref:Uncharacterized protein n=1 Tax=Aspergillus indologenus CBS 114.80 TaxID=1450541 RepID=A0A2V5HP31_9EURO|nr:hypothetical protein BP00DRAFT_68238 [Aspergillus indologenus CBS 114.80]